MYRESRGMTQAKLAELSEISITTIKKYELGHRNPKSDQLVKIAAALGINASTFYNLDISTVGDVMALLFKISDATEIEFDGANSKGNFDGFDVVLRFNDPTIAQCLAEWAEMRTILSDMKKSADEKIDDQVKAVVYGKMNEMMSEFRLLEMDNTTDLDAWKLTIQNTSKGGYITRDDIDAAAELGIPLGLYLCRNIKTESGSTDDNQ